jgi:hypothetical protein
MVERLTTLAAVKGWLDITGAESDVELTRIIEAASQFVLNYLNREGFAARQYTQNCLGNGQHSMLLRNWPVISVSSVGVAGTVIPASTLGVGGLPGSGYTISDPRTSAQSLSLYGHSFYYRAPCQVIYTAGYETSQTVTLTKATEDDTTILVTPTAGGQWVSDTGVLIDSVAAAKVTADPQAGEYSVDGWGVYTFNAADDGKEAIISYAYCPADIAFGVTEIIAEWYKRRDRIGILSKTLGGQETITFTNQEMSSAVRAYLQPYQNVVPI